MKGFSYFAPTEIVYGRGKAEELGRLAARYGKRALLTTGPGNSPALGGLYRRLRELLQEAGVETEHFDGVRPNPTTDQVTAGARLAREFGAELVIGVGGGSALDTAKAIAVEASHEGTAWDYLHFTAGPTEKTLPILAVGTTAGTGSQVTPCAVITKTEKKDKSAIWHRNIFPRAAVVDPSLTDSMPPAVTAQTGFDAFCHCFEAYLSAGCNPMVEVLALEGIRLVARFLPRAVRDGTDTEARDGMAWADTLGGLANASAGVTLPHGLGMQIGGHCPWVTHGQALAAIYPAFLRYTAAWAVPKFAAVGRIFSPSLASASDEAAAQGACAAIEAFLGAIGLRISLSSLGIQEDALGEIARCGQVLSDYKNNPRVATIEEMDALLRESWEMG